MAVTNVQFLASKESESMSYSSDSSQFDRITGTAKYHYAVHCDGPMPIDDAIRNGVIGGVNHIEPIGTLHPAPGQGAPYPEWICSDKEVSYHEGSATIYDVVQTWSKLQVPNTLPIISVNGRRYTENAYVDIEQKPIVNSAKQPFTPALQREYHDMEIVATFNRWGIDVGMMETLRGKVNDGNVVIPGIPFTFTARQLKIDEISYSNVYTAWQGYWAVSIRFCARADKYITKVIDQGYYTNKADYQGEYTKQIILDKYGEPIQTPQLLDGNGDILPPENIDTPIILEFKIEQEASFEGLINSMTW